MASIINLLLVFFYVSRLLSCEWAFLMAETTAMKHCRNWVMFYFALCSKTLQFCLVIIDHFFLLSYFPCFLARKLHRCKVHIFFWQTVLITSNSKTVLFAQNITFFRLFLKHTSLQRVFRIFKTINHKLFKTGLILYHFLCQNRHCHQTLTMKKNSWT